jgi:hypothetical protein
MFIECYDECRVQHGGRTYLFEERARFGYVYKVDEELAKAATATGKCAEVRDYKGPFELPSSAPIPVPPASASAPGAPPATSQPPAAPKPRGRRALSEGG